MKKAKPLLLMILSFLLGLFIIWQLGPAPPPKANSYVYQGFDSIKPVPYGTGLTEKGDYNITFLNTGGSAIQPRKLEVSLMENNITKSISWNSTEFDQVEQGNNFMINVKGIQSGKSEGDSYEAKVELTYEIIVGSMKAQKTSGARGYRTPAQVSCDYRFPGTVSR